MWSTNREGQIGAFGVPSLIVKSQWFNVTAMGMTAVELMYCVTWFKTWERIVVLKGLHWMFGIHFDLRENLHYLVFENLKYKDILTGDFALGYYPASR